MLMNLRDMYAFCKAMMEAAVVSGNQSAIDMWEERAYDAYLVLHHES